MALDPQGQLWVADTGHDRFVILAADGSVVETWGTGGSGDGQFSLQRDNGDPYGAIAFAPDGSFYVLDVGNLRIQHFDKDRAFLGSWGAFGTGPGQYADPIGIAVDAKGMVYVLDDVRDVVETYDASGKVLGSFDAHPRAHLGTTRPTGSLSMRTATSMSASAAMQATSSRSSTRLARCWEPSAVPVPVTVSSRTSPGSWSSTPSGRLFVSEGGPTSHVKVFDADGGFLSTLDTSAADDGAKHWTTSGLALDGHGNLYVGDMTDSNQDRIKKVQLLAPLTSP